MSVDWNDNAQLVFPTTQGVAVYRNTEGNIVICQQAADMHDEDDYVIVPRAHLPALITALQELAD